MKPGRKTAAAAALVIGLAGPAEGLRYVAYRDPGGVLTVCAGHTGPDVIAGRLYSRPECDALMVADAEKAVAAVERCHPALPLKVRAAFGDAAFNLGPAIACDRGRSTAARLLYAGDLRGACEELPKWNKVRIAGVLVPLPGLTKRRALERALCLEGLE